jgi:hypothetical protein
MSRLLQPATTALFLLLLGATPALAASEPGSQPAGGAAIAEIAIATVAAGIVTTALLVLGMGHRSGRVPWLGQAARLSERISGLPGWTALPAGIATTSLITAVFGMYWDIALHIGIGRDEGPLANPAHYFILAGLFGIFAAGFVAMVLPTPGEVPSKTSIRITRDWHAPLGGVLICACGAFSLIGFPLDDMWHRLFGQDVTLWGPTHLMLIGGAAMTLVGIAVLVVEGVRAGDGARGTALSRFLTSIWLPGGFMLGLSTFQAEFDFGVPQFRFVFQPMLIMLAAGVGLVVARMWGGRGAALGAVAFFLLVRGVLYVLVDPVFGEPTPHMPLYIGEALLVEAAALLVATDRPLRFGLVCGVLIGTIGLAAEWAWSHTWMVLPWPGELLPEAAILGFAMALAGGLLGAWIGHRLSIVERPTIPSLRTGAVIGALIVAVCVVYGLQKPADSGVRAAVELTDVRGGEQREVDATVRLTPADAADDAEWLQVTAWQGGGLIVNRMERVSQGVYRTTQPIPVHGNWKALVRLHHGNSLTAAPIFLPRDAAIPADEVPAEARFERAFVADHAILQREQKDTSGWLSTVGYAIVAGIALSLLVLLAWGLHRLGTPDGRPRQQRDRSASAPRLDTAAGHA